MYGDSLPIKPINGMQNKTKHTRSISYYHSIKVSLIPQRSIIHAESDLSFTPSWSFVGLPMPTLFVIHKVSKSHDHQKKKKKT
jgi:hypothetical protein